MGYCYEGRKLCCDNCGVAGGVRKRKCPYGYCPAAALCNRCAKRVKANGKWAAMHANCEAGHAKYLADLALRTTLVVPTLES